MTIKSKKIPEKVVNNTQEAITKDTHKISYDRNHDIIINTIMKCLKEDGKFPTYEKIAELTEFHINTVWAHAKEFNWNDFLPKYKLYSPKLMENILKTAQKNAASQRLASEILGMTEATNQTNIQLNIQVNLPDILNE